ncbi:MAG: hypothetical protein HY913_09105 [Desulfomonile tiedjei]|nr:hypothetical protein [Desulfomonile tiedjei]
MTPIHIEVVVPLITALEFRCSRCGPIFEGLDVQKHYRDSCEDDYPEDWKQDLARLGDCLQKISETYKHRVRIKIIDAQSPLGLWKQLRHRVSGTPAFVVDGKDVCVGWNIDRLEELVDARIDEASRQIAARLHRGS